MQLFFSFTEKSAHDLLPLAHEYQVRKLNRIENFLIEWVKEQYDAIPSKQIIKSILEAEKFQLLKYLNECIGVASRKKHKNLVDNPRFEEISQETRLKISCKRWSDVDSVVNSTWPWIREDVRKKLTPFMQDN
jgi:hypothetical protein